MAKEAVGVAFLLGLIVLGSAAFVPQLMDVTVDNARTDFEADVGVKQNITDYLQFNVSDINQGQNTTNVTVRNNATLNTTIVKLNVTETKTAQLSGDSIKVNFTAAVDSDTGQYRLTYPPMFGWAHGPRLFMENMDVVLVSLGFALIGMGLVGFVSD